MDQVLGQADLLSHLIRVNTLFGTYYSQQGSGRGRNLARQKCPSRDHEICTEVATIPKILLGPFIGS